MSIIHIPNQQIKQVTGILPGLFFGDISKFFNIDLNTKKGRILLAKAGYKLTDSDTLATLDVIDAFVRTNADNTDRYWALGTQGDLFNSSGDNPYTGWAIDGLSGTPADAADFAIHESANGEERLVVTRSSDIAILNSANHANTWISSWWLARNIASSTNAAPIEITTSAAHGFSTGDTISISDHLINTAANGTWIITVVNSTKFTLDDSTGNGIGGATGTSGYLNQPALTAGIEHPVDVFNRMAIIGDDNFIHTIDKNNVVEYKKLTLPSYLRIIHIFHSKERAWICTRHKRSGEAVVIEWDGYSNSYLYEHPIESDVALSGIVYKNTPFVVTGHGKILYHNGSSFTQFKKAEFPLQELGLKFNYNYSGATTSIKPKGMAVKNGLIYIYVNVNLTDFSNLLPERLISGTWCLDPENGNFYHLYSFGQRTATTTDFGQPILRAAGGLLALNGIQAELLAGGGFYKTNTTTAKGLWRIVADFSTSNRGYFETVKIPTANISDKWDTIWIKFRKFIDSNNRIIIKSRTNDPYEQGTSGNPGVQLNAAITWVNATSFTSVVPAGIVVGDEVEVLAGDNAGCLFHISGLSATPDGSSTITVTLDEAAPSVVTETALVKFDNWKKIGTISDTTIQSAFFPVSHSKGDFIQLKIEMRGTSVEIEEIKLQ